MNSWESSALREAVREVASPPELNSPSQHYHAVGKMGTFCAKVFLGVGIKEAVAYHLPLGVILLSEISDMPSSAVPNTGDGESTI